MTIWNKIIGHGPIIEKLKIKLSKNFSSSSSLFYGPSGVGKKLVALGYAQALICQEKNKPCGTCSSCQRVEKRSHPDLMVLELNDETGVTLKIEAIRNVQNFMSLRSYEGGAKVVIIDEAHTMTAQAANSLLKTLEEPPVGSHFILLTSNRGAVLSTIQSRCQRVLFGGLTEDQVQKIIPDLEPWAAQLSGGRLDLASKYKDQEFRELRQKALKVLQNVGQARTFEGFTSLEDLIEDRESAQFTLHCWLQLIVLATRSKTGATSGLTNDEVQSVKSLMRLSNEDLTSVGQKILRLEQDLQGNISRSLAFEKFWMELKQLHV